MSNSVRDAVSTLQLDNLKGTYNLRDVYKFMQIDTSIAVSDLLNQILSLPESIPFHVNIVTDQALGGEASVILHRDGTSVFSGFMRATGFFSFSYTVSVFVKTPGKKVILSAQHSGDVFGTDTPGPRDNHWEETESNPKRIAALRTLWPLMAGSQMVVNESAKLAGSLVKLSKLIKNVTEFFLVAETAGPTTAVLLIIGSELGDAGVEIPGFGGVVGIMVIEGAIFLYGPLGIGPAFLIGVTAGAIIDALIGIRKLTNEEQNFARQVFGNSLDFDRIRLTNMVGMGGRPFTYPTVDDHILINIGISDAMYNSPATTTRLGSDGTKSTSMPAPGQVLIHELTHAWQIQHATFPGFVPGYLCDGITSQVFLGQSSYTYGPPGADWNSYHMEAQAHIVDDWYGGSGRQFLPTSPERPDGTLIQAGDVEVRMDENSPYFSYIANNIWAGIS